MPEMMTPDPKWLEILKASGWQTAALAAACGLFWLVGRWGWLPPLDPWMIQAAAFGFFVTGFLAVASSISAISRAYRDYRARVKAAQPAHYEPIPDQCRWALAKQQDGSFSTQIVGKIFVSNLTDNHNLSLLPNVRLIRPKIRGEIVSNTISIEDQWGLIRPHDVGEAHILILAKGTITRWKRRELPVTVVITSHPPSKQRVTFRCRPMHPPELVIPRLIA